MQALGLTGTKLRRHMMDTAAARRGDENVSTPDEIVRLLQAMHGAGIVYAKNRPYVFCVMTTFLKDEAEGERAIEAMSRAAYEYFSRLPDGPLGRRFGR